MSARKSGSRRRGFLCLLSMGLAFALPATAQEISEPFGNTAASTVLGGVAGAAPSVVEREDSDFVSASRKRGEMLFDFQTSETPPGANMVALFGVDAVDEVTAFAVACPDFDFPSGEAGAYALATEADRNTDTVHLVYILNPLADVEVKVPNLKAAQYISIGEQVDLYSFRIVNESPKQGVTLKVKPELREWADACTRVRFSSDRFKQRAGFGLADAESALITNVQYRLGRSRFELRGTWANTDLEEGTPDQERVTGQFRVGLRSRLKQARKTQVILIADYRDNRGSSASRTRVFLSGSMGLNKNGICQSASACPWALTTNIGWQEKEDAASEDVDDVRATFAVSYAVSSTASISADYSVDNDVDGQDGYSLTASQALGNSGQFGTIFFGILKDGVITFSYLMTF